MLKSLGQLALAGVSLAVLAGCDAPKAPEPAPVVEAAATPPPPKPFDGASALAAVDQAILCAMFARASTDEKVQVANDDCVVTAGSSNITIATKDGSSTLLIPLVEAGASIDLTAETASARAVPDAVHGAFENAGAVFIGRAPASGLCLMVDYFAPDAGSNSLYVLVAGAKTDRLMVKANPEAVAQANYGLPVVAGGAIAPFAVTRREPKLALKKVTMRAC